MIKYQLYNVLFGKQLHEQLAFNNSPDEDKPGNNQLIIFNQAETYTVEGNTHGNMGHAIKHFSEFNNEAVTGILNQAIAAAVNSPNLILKNAKSGQIMAQGPAAAKQITPGAMLNTFDMINDKIANNQQLLPEEAQIKPLLDQLTQQYNQVINQYRSAAVDIDNISDPEQIKALIAKQSIVKFTGVYSGKENLYYLNFANSGLIAEMQGTISTLFRIDKKGASLDVIKKYFSRGTIPKNPAFSQALGIESPTTETPEAPKAAINETIMFYDLFTHNGRKAESWFDLTHWQKMSGVLKG